jgi:hypothetical protein
MTTFPKAADALSGFPSSIKDTRTFRLGAFGPNYAGGGVEMIFSCVDSVGHAVALINLRSDGCKGPGEPQSVSLYIPVEAGEIDSFVTKARSVGDTEGQKAYLHIADHTVGCVKRGFPDL